MCDIIEVKRAWKPNTLFNIQYKPAFDKTASVHLSYNKLNVIVHQ